MNEVTPAFRGIFNEQGRQTTTGERFTACGHQQRDHDDGFPRTRGDAPGSACCRGRVNSVPPHARGCAAAWKSNPSQLHLV